MIGKPLLLSFLLCAGACGAPAAETSKSSWPEWDAFAKRFVQADGRVIDLTFDAKSTSEGQSYGMFFALVANDQAKFDSILSWTSDNLAGGKLGDRLPAWLWGKRDDGTWGVKDENAASDADLWIAYSLLEADRLWKSPRYAATARKLLARIQAQEIVNAGSAGLVLLPGPVGFTLETRRYRINPSYLPEFMFRYLAEVDPRGSWQGVWDGFLRMAPRIFSAGVAPDIVIVDSSGKVMPDSEREPSGSYDAIRVYLWAGMSGNQQMLKLLPRYAALVRQYGMPPEKVDPGTGAATKSDFSPLGFAGAVLPYLSALPDHPGLQQQRQRLRAAALRATLGETTHYYDQVLILFGTGWVDGQYGFDDRGRLLPRWAR
jgi:endo-1,4-beta-D-glucanase Y